MASLAWVSLALLAAPCAHAGTVTQGTWNPTACGPQPQAPALNLKDADAFNRSVDGVNTYRKAQRDYLNCLTQEANADIQALVKAATATQQAAQQAAQQANEKIDADVKAAANRFK